MMIKLSLKYNINLAFWIHRKMYFWGSLIIVSTLKTALIVYQIIEYRFATSLIIVALYLLHHNSVTLIFK